MPLSSCMMYPCCSHILLSFTMDSVAFFSVSPSAHMTGMILKNLVPLSISSTAQRYSSFFLMREGAKLPTACCWRTREHFACIFVLRLVNMILRVYRNGVVIWSISDATPRSPPKSMFVW